ncbi:MAG: DUF4249 family protein [Flavobacteriaceae bacterium]|nr:DUF4249 family protein [Flavobacteriaceae bacterium]
MKKILILLIIFLTCVQFSSCEDVVEVTLPTEPPRLIIDALIRVDTSQSTTIAQVTVKQTNSFFETIIPANLQQITIFNSETNNAFILIEDPIGSGIYKSETSTTSLMNGGEFFLQVDFEDEFFVAYATFQPTSNIDTIVFGDGTLFDEDDTEIIIEFTDNPERDDFYLFDFDLGNYLVSEDEFYQGQQFSFSYFYDEVLSTGDELEISIMGIDEGFANYMNKLIEQSEGAFGPFETPAITVRGNIINATTIDNENNFDNTDTSNNFALGYFAIVQENKQTLIVK